LRSAVRKIPFYYVLSVVLFGLFFRVWHNPQPYVLFFVFVLPAVPMLVLYGTLRWSRKRYEAAVQDSAAGVLAASEPVPAASPSEPPPDFRLLLEMPRPRPVRVSSKGRTNLAIAMLGVAAFALIFLIHVWSSYRAAGSFADLPRADWLWLALAAGIALLPYATWKNVQRQKALLATGEVALARVVRQMSNRSTFTIQYEFQDAKGQTVKGFATDVTRSVYEGMSVPVFFDAQDPGRRVVQCESFCEVALRERE
jgi:hypothetical protein